MLAGANGERGEEEGGELRRAGAVDPRGKLISTPSTEHRREQGVRRQAGRGGGGRVRVESVSTRYHSAVHTIPRPWAVHALCPPLTQDSQFAYPPGGALPGQSRIKSDIEPTPRHATPLGGIMRWYYCTRHQRSSGQETGDTSSTGSSEPGLARSLY